MWKNVQSFNYSLGSYNSLVEEWTAFWGSTEVLVLDQSNCAISDQNKTNNTCEGWLEPFSKSTFSFPRDASVQCLNNIAHSRCFGHSTLLQYGALWMKTWTFTAQGFPAVWKFVHTGPHTVLHNPKWHVWNNPQKGRVRGVFVTSPSRAPAALLFQSHSACTLLSGKQQLALQAPQLPINLNRRSGSGSGNSTVCVYQLESHIPYLFSRRLPGELRSREAVGCALDRHHVSFLGHLSRSWSHNHWNSCKDRRRGAWIPKASVNINTWGEKETARKRRWGWDSAPERVGYFFTKRSSKQWSMFQSRQLPPHFHLLAAQVKGGLLKMHFPRATLCEVTWGISSFYCVTSSPIRFGWNLLTNHQFCCFVFPEGCNQRVQHAVDCSAPFSGKSTMWWCLMEGWDKKLRSENGHIWDL